ncbi:MAG: hypothetical protein GVY13_16540, partial [Alphaproteobacteria bacterium]|nr:hypothetical protein [Alphaproteobacteria bacterium]
MSTNVTTILLEGSLIEQASWDLLQPDDYPWPRYLDPHPEFNREGFGHLTLVGVGAGQWMIDGQPAERTILGIS